MVQLASSLSRRPVEASPQRIEAVDGFGVQARVYEPAAAAAATVLIHGATATPQSYYRRFAEYLAQAHMRVVTYDYRGIGASRPPTLRGFSATMSQWATHDARAVIAALFHGRPNRAYNVSDDSEMKMGAWFDLVADAFHLPRPPRITWDAAERQIAPTLLSFMSESRRLVNDRLKRELRFSLAHPTPHATLAQTAPRALTRQLALPIG